MNPACTYKRQCENPPVESMLHNAEDERHGAGEPLKRRAELSGGIEATLERPRKMVADLEFLDTTILLPTMGDREVRPPLRAAS